MADSNIMERGNDKGRNRISATFYRVHWPREELTEIIQHTTVLVAALASIGLVHMALTAFLGHDAKFYDTIPVRYVIDTGHLTMLIRFVWKLTQQIWSDDV